MSLSEHLASRVLVVLVQPQHPGNVGSAARAMKNMGLRRLVVVDPPGSFDPERARWMAPGAADILRDARLVATLDEALDQVHRVVGATARHRRHHQRVLQPQELADEVFSEFERTTAILFGREDHGLSADATTRCEALLRIPTDHHASLNLAQAVLITCHHLFETARQRGLQEEGRLLGGGGVGKPTSGFERRTPKDGIAFVGQVEPAITELVSLLNRVGYTMASSPEQVEVLMREGLQRAGLTRKQVHAVRGMVRRMEYALDHPSVDWRMSRRQKQKRAAAEADHPFEE